MFFFKPASVGCMSSMGSAAPSSGPLGRIKHQKAASGKPFQDVKCYLQRWIFNVAHSFFMFLEKRHRVALRIFPVTEKGGQRSSLLIFTQSSLSWRFYIMILWVDYKLKKAFKSFFSTILIIRLLQTDIALKLSVSWTYYNHFIQNTHLLYKFLNADNVRWWQRELCS